MIHDDAETSPQIPEQNPLMAPDDEFEITYEESVDKDSMANQKEPSVQSTISFERLNRDGGPVESGRLRHDELKEIHDKLDFLMEKWQ